MYVLDAKERTEKSKHNKNNQLRFVVEKLQNYAKVRGLVWVVGPA